MRLTQIKEMITRHGLLVLGAYSASSVYRILVGNAGSAFWQDFTKSPEFTDNKTDPLDRWSRRIGDSVARETGARVIFPFDGPPYPPFLDWAAETGQGFTSPISISIHRKYGLWHAYRFALELDEIPADAVPAGVTFSPCDSCEEKPCLCACPVNAFDNGKFQVQKCMNYLRVDEYSACRSRGCAARGACPFERKYQYQPDHAQFHMNAFVASDL